MNIDITEIKSTILMIKILMCFKWWSWKIINVIHDVAKNDMYSNAIIVQSSIPKIVIENIRLSSLCLHWCDYSADSVIDYQNKHIRKLYLKCICT